ncbi:hypothetical protein GGF50DRAFT_46145 [Schizophyllum commune]
MARSIGIAESRKQIAQLTAAINDSTRSNENRDPAHQRVLLNKLDGLFRRGRPFIDLDGKPPLRNPTDKPLHPQDPKIANVIRSLALYFGALCMDLDNLQSPADPTVVYQHLLSYVPVVLQWLDFVHPMNGNVKKDEEDVPMEHMTICYPIIITLTGLCTPRLYGGVEKMREYLLSTHVLLYVTDLWTNLFRYAKRPSIATAALTVKLLYKFAFDGFSGEKTSRIDIADDVAYAIRQRQQNRPRRMCRLITRYATLFEGPAQEQAALELFRFASNLTSVPGLAPLSCPRSVIRALVTALQGYANNPHCGAPGLCLMYLAEIWTKSRNQKALEWSLNDGVFLIFFRLLASQTGTILILDPTGKSLQDGFAFWRVLDAFERNNAHLIPELRRVAPSHPAMANILTAYDARITVHRRAGEDWKARKKRADYSYVQCTNASNTRRPRMRACACRGAWYCSAECQRAHWQEHRQQCLYADGRQTTMRDVHFGAALAYEYLYNNPDLITSEALALDPHRQHIILLAIDLRPAMLQHRVVIGGPKNPSDTMWRGLVSTCWREGGVDRMELIDGGFDLYSWDPYL